MEATRQTISAFTGVPVLAERLESAKGSMCVRARAIIRLAVPMKKLFQVVSRPHRAPAQSRMYMTLPMALPAKIFAKTLAAAGDSVFR